MSVTDEPRPNPWRPVPEEAATRPRTPGLTGWGGYVARRPRRVLWTTVVALVVFAALTPIFLAKLIGIGYDTPGSQSDRATKVVEQALGAQEAALIVVSSETRTAADPTFQRTLDEAVRVAEATEGVASVPPADVGGAVSEDGKTAYRTVLLSGGAGERQDTSEQLKHDLADLDASAL